MAKNSRAKGKAGELELAALLRAHGFEARRGQQYAGGGDSPDIVHDMTGFHVECKRTEALRLYDALAQAHRDKKPDEQAVVFHRANNRPWVVVMDAGEFLKLVAEYVYERGSRDTEETAK